MLRVLGVFVPIHQGQRTHALKLRMRTHIVIRTIALQKLFHFSSSKMPINVLKNIVTNYVTTRHLI
jgi:hypothetical protein